MAAARREAARTARGAAQPSFRPGASVARGIGLDGRTGQDPGAPLRLVVTDEGRRARMSTEAARFVWKLTTHAEMPMPTGHS